MRVHMSLEEKRKLLDSAKGQYFSVCWVKKSGETREAIAKKWERRFLHGEPGQNKTLVPISHTCILSQSKRWRASAQ